MAKICSVEECTNVAIKRGWCSKHYQRWRTGRTMERSNRDPNRTEIVGGVAYISLYSNNQNDHKEIARAVIDVVDLPQITGHKWHFDTGYATTRNPDGGKIYMHRLVLPDVTEVDHINGNRLDNRRNNLRAATRSENLSNIPARKRNKLGHKNISYDGRRKSGYAVDVNFEGKRHRARFETLDEAIKHRNALLLRVHGSFGRTD